MMQKKKMAKPIFHDEAIFEEKLALFSTELSTIESSLKLLRKNSKRPGDYLNLDDIIGLMKVFFSKVGRRIRYE